MAESLSKEFSAQASVQPSNGMTETGRNSTGSPPGHSAYPNLNFGPSISSTPGAYTQGYPQTQNSASPRDIAYGKPISGPPQQQQMNTLTPAPYLPQQSQQQYPPQQHAQYPPQQYAPSYQYQPQSPSTVYAPPGTQPVVSPPPYQQQYQPQQYQPQQYLPTQPQPTADLHSRALRLVEMGFPYDQCMQALSANGGNEEAALNSLLSSSASSGATSSPPVSTTAPTRLSATSAPQKPPKAGAGTGAGLYGNPWGRN